MKYEKKLAFLIIMLSLLGLYSVNAKETKLPSNVSNLYAASSEKAFT